MTITSIFLSYRPRHAPFVSWHTFGSYKYYACQYLDMAFDTADDRMCDYEALERDYYDTEYLKPKYLDNYWEIFTKENATNEAIKAVIDSGNAFILKNFTNPGLKALGGPAGLQYMADNAPNKTYGVRNTNWLSDVIDVPLNEAISAIKDNKESWLLFFDNGLMFDISRISEMVHKFALLLLDQFPSMYSVGLRSDMTKYVTATFVYYGRWWKTPLHQARAAGFFIQLSNTKLWTVVPHQYQMWMRTMLAMEPQVRMSEYLCINRSIHVPIFEMLVEPGDLLYLPPYWLHQVVSLEDTPGVMIGLRPLSTTLPNMFANTFLPFFYGREDVLHNQLFWFANLRALGGILFGAADPRLFTTVIQNPNEILKMSYLFGAERQELIKAAYSDPIDEKCLMRQEEDPSYWGYSVIQRDEWGHPIAPEACEA